MYSLLIVSNSLLATLLAIFSGRENKTHKPVNAHLLLIVKFTTPKWWSTQLYASVVEAAAAAAPRNQTGNHKTNIVISGSYQELAILPFSFASSSFEPFLFP